MASSDSEPDYDRYDCYDTDYGHYDSGDEDLYRSEFHSNGDFYGSDRAVTLTSGAAQSPNAIDCDQTVETWIIKDANTALARKSAEHKFNFQLNHLRFPGVIWSVSLSLPKEGGETESEQMIFSHSAKFSGNTKHCWTSVVAELIRYVKMPQASSDKDQAQPNVEILGAVSLGPNELINRESSGVKCEAWPLPLMLSAISDDGTRHIRLILSLHDVDRDIRSRDLVRGLHQSGILSDFIIKVDQQEFPVHKCVLAAASGEFKALLRDSNPGDSLDLTGVGTASGVKALLALVYGGEYAWMCDNDPIATIRNVLLLAGQYKVKQVEAQLVRAVQKLISLDNVWDLLNDAVDNNALGVAAACFTFLLQNRGTISKPELLAMLMANTERNVKVHCCFIEAFFNRQLPCSPTCCCTKSSAAYRSRVNTKPLLFPNEDFKLSISWQFRCSEANLTKTRELTDRTDEDTSLANAVGRCGYEEENIYWRLQLYPNGRNKIAERQGCASLVVSLCPYDDYHHSHSRWAYDVEFNLNVGGVNIPANLGAASGTLFEFTNNPKGLAIDFAWPVATLRDAVGADDKIFVTAEMRVPNVQEVLNCCEAVRNNSTNNESAHFTALRQLIGSNTDRSQTQESWTIKNATKALESTATLCSHQSQHAFDFKEHWAFPGLRLKIRPCSSYRTPGAPSLNLKAEFGPKVGDIRRCGAIVTAEIQLPSSQGVAEATTYSVKLGPIEFSDEQSDQSFPAWPLDVMRSAINAEHDTLSIQLTLVLFKINDAVQTYRSIRELRTNGRGSDFIFKLGNEQFRAHKCVFATASDEFKKLFCGEEQINELVLPEKTTASGMKAFLALVYFDAYDWQADANVADTISDVLILSHQYKIERVKKQVADVIVKIVSTGNVVRLLEAAVSCEASGAKDVCITFLLENRAKIRNTDCIAQLLRNDRISGDFLSAFFGQNLCCSRACDCAKLPKSVASTIVSKEKSIPENVGANELSYTWIIENAAALLNPTEPIIETAYALLNQPVLRQSLRFTQLDHRLCGRSWEASMLPSGRTTIARYEEFASLTVTFTGAFQEFCHADYFWAHVEAQIESMPISVRVLFEFTQQARTLSIDKFCSTVALRKAIRSSDNTLHIHVKITLVGDIPASLRCQEMVRLVYKQRSFTDFILTCKDELIRVHKSVLAQRSDVFAALLSSDMKEAQEGRLDLSDVTTVDGLKAFVDGVYFGELNCTDGEVLLELLKLANLYGLADIKSHCDQHLARNIDMENALDVLATCELYGLRVAKSACVRFLGENGLKFLKSSTWQDLSKNESQVGLLQTLTKELLLRGKFRGVDD